MHLAKPRHLVLFLLFLGLLAAAQPASSQLILSGVIDGPLTGGLPKAIEIFVESNVADLSTCGVGSANNGGGTDGEEFTFPADPATAGDFIYVATESVEFMNWFGFAPDYTDGLAPNINGDDAIELFCGGMVIDVFGDINTDGTGQPWEHLDGLGLSHDGHRTGRHHVRARQLDLQRSQRAGRRDRQRVRGDTVPEPDLPGRAAVVLDRLSLV